MVCKWHYLLDGCWRSSQRGENPNDRCQVRVFRGPCQREKVRWLGPLSILVRFGILVSYMITKNQATLSGIFWVFCCWLSTLLEKLGIILDIFRGKYLCMFTGGQKMERSTSREVSVFQDNQCPKTCWVRVSSPATFSSSSTWWFKSLLWKTAILFQDLHIKNGDCPEGKQINHHLSLLAINLIDYSIKQFLKFQSPCIPCNSCFLSSMRAVPRYGICVAGFGPLLGALVVLGADGHRL